MNVIGAVADRLSVPVIPFELGSETVVSVLAASETEFDVAGGLDVVGNATEPGTGTPELLVQPALNPRMATATAA